MNYWLFVETYHNWIQDEINEFRYMGIAISKFKQKGIKKNDKFITYISKKKKISDLRIIIDDKLCDCPKTLNYDREFTKVIKTRLVTKIEKNNWINFDQFVKQLEIFKDKAKPGLVLINAPVLLPINDFKYLQSLINKKN